MNTLKELINKLSTQKLMVKIFISFLAICSLIAIEFLMVKAIPYIFLICILIWLAYDKIKEKNMEEQQIAQMQQQYQDSQLTNCYLYIAEQLVNVLREYNNLIGIKVTTVNSVLCTNKTWCMQQSSLWFYRYLVEITSEIKIDYDNIRNIINNRLLQESFDYPVWIKRIHRANNYLEFVVTVMDNELSYQYREKYEQMKHMNKTNDKTNTADKDF